VSVNEAKCFTITKEMKFYNQVKVPEQQMYEKENKLIEAMHIRFLHASTGELKRILKLNLQEFEQLTAANIDHWHQEMGKFCIGCMKGKMKEHARIHSSKPLQSDKPGDVTVGDIMFVEGLKNIKKLLMIHVDVCSKFVTGVTLKDKLEQYVQMQCCRSKPFTQETKRS